MVFHGFSLIILIFEWFLPVFAAFNIDLTEIFQEVSLQVTGCDDLGSSPTELKAKYPELALEHLEEVWWTVPERFQDLKAGLRRLENASKRLENHEKVHEKSHGGRAPESVASRRRRDGRGLPVPR